MREAEDKDPIAAPGVYLAPPDYHLLLEPGRLALSTDEIVNFSRPSIDVLFESAADAYGEAVVAVLLTGANSDGARGLGRVRAAGGYAIVQDPATAESKEMPAAAVKDHVFDKVLPLDEIARELLRIAPGKPTKKNSDGQRSRPHEDVGPRSRTHEDVGPPPKGNV